MLSAPALITSSTSTGEGSSDMDRSPVDGEPDGGAVAAGHGAGVVFEQCVSPGDDEVLPEVKSQAARSWAGSITVTRAVSIGVWARPHLSLTLCSSL